MKASIFAFLLFFFLPDTRGSSPLPSDSVYRLEQTWTSQNGKLQSLSDLKGAPILAAMIFTSCPATCPAIVSYLKSLDSQLTKHEKKNVRFALFSIDPVRDTPEKLLSFAKKMKLDERWMLLTSGFDEVRELSVALGFNYKQMENGDYTHSTSIYLLSSSGKLVMKSERRLDSREFLEEVRKQVKLNSK